MALLLSFFLGILITAAYADKCCKFYVSPPSTVLVQLKNHNIIGAVPRQSPATHYSSHLIPQSTAPNNYFLVNYHANGNPNYVYHTTPPQNSIQNGMYGVNQQASYVAPAWQQSYYQAPGYLPATVVPQASYAIQQNETKKQASYFVSSAYFSNSTEIKENDSQQNVPIISQHQLGDHSRNAENTAITDDTSIDQAEAKYTQPPFPIVTSSLLNNGLKSKENNQENKSSTSSQPTITSNNYQENTRDVNTATSTKHQSVKPSPTPSTSFTTNVQTSSQYTTLLPNGTLLNKQNEQIGTIDKTKNNIGIQRQMGSNNTSEKRLGITNTSETSFHLTTVLNKSSNESAKTTPTSVTKSNPTQENYSTHAVNQQTDKSNNASKTTKQSSSKTTSSESASTLSTSTVFTVIPVHRDAQRYGNNPYDDQNSVVKLNALNTILFLSLIIHSILITIR